MSDKFLACPGFAADQYCCITAGHLVDMAVYIAHGVGIAYDVLRSKSIFKFITKAKVFIFKLLLLKACFPSGLDICGDHARDNTNNAHILIQRSFFIEELVDRDRSDDLLSN